MINPIALAARSAATRARDEIAEKADESASGYWSRLRRAVSAGAKDRRLPVAQQGRRGTGRGAAA